MVMGLMMVARLPMHSQSRRFIDHQDQPVAIENAVDQKIFWMREAQNKGGPVWCDLACHISTWGKGPALVILSAQILPSFNI